MKIKRLNIFEDSHVIFSWLLTKQAAKKNQMVNNKLNKINDLVASLNKRNIEVCYEYVPPACNIGDIIYRGTFVQNLLNDKEQWVRGSKCILQPTGQ